MIRQNKFFCTTVIVCFIFFLPMVFLFSDKASAGGACWYGDCRVDGSFCDNSGNCLGPLTGYNSYNSNIHSLCVNGVNMKGCIDSWSGSTQRSSHPQNGSYCIKGDCISKPAAVNGGWTSFPSCPACAPTGYSVTRTCTNPIPADGGAYCTGSSTQTCNVPVCVPEKEDNGCLTDEEYNAISHCPVDCSTKIDGYKCNYEDRSLVKPCPFKKAVSSTKCRPPIFIFPPIIASNPTGGISIIGAGPIGPIVMGGCDFGPCRSEPPGRDTITGGGGGGLPPQPPLPPTIEPTGSGSGGRSMPTGDAGDSIDGMCKSCPSKDYSTA